MKLELLEVQGEIAYKLFECGEVVPSPADGLSYHGKLMAVKAVRDALKAADMSHDLKLAIKIVQTVCDQLVIRMTVR